MNCVEFLVDQNHKLVVVEPKARRRAKREYRSSMLRLLKREFDLV